MSVTTLAQKQFHLVKHAEIKLPVGKELARDYSCILVWGGDGRGARKTTS